MLFLYYPKCSTCQKAKKWLDADVYKRQDYIFATIQTLSKEETLQRYSRQRFDAIVIDEAHHSAANSYKKVLDYFQPKLWLGMTATPDKRDDNLEGRNIYEIFNHQIAYEIRLQDAMEEDLSLIHILHKIGEDFTLSASGEDKDGNNIVNDKISAHVDSVQTADDLKLLNGADLPEEWENVINSNGKLVKNKVSYIKSGDGVNSVDRVIKTENVNQKLVYATVTYTNNSDQEIKHMLYIGNLALIRHENGEYHIYNAMEQSGNGYDRVSWDGVAHTAEMTYSSVREDYGNGGNYISSLKPGESIQVNMAWIVNEDNLADMYLNLDGEGGAYDFNEGMLEAGVVDIRKDVYKRQVL